MSTRLATIVLCLVPLASCVSDGEIAELVRAEQTIEEGREALEALPVRTAEQEAVLAEAKAKEAELEAAIANAARFTKRGWIDTAMQGVGKGASQDYPGLLELLAALGVAAGGLFLVDKRAKKGTGELAERIDRTLTPQGIAGLSASSAEKERSGAAKAGRLAQTIEQERWLEQRRYGTGLTAMTGAYEGDYADHEAGLN